MNTQELQLVTFEQAKRLKEFGFDWEVCDYTYSHEYSPIWDNSEDHNKWDSRISLPTVALALKWIRDTKGKIYDFIVALDSTFNFKIYRGLGEWTDWYKFSTYESAEIALLDELLTILDKENEND